MSGHFFDSECVLETESRLSRRKRRIDFGYNKDKIKDIPINEIPAIRIELVLDLFDETCRPINVQTFSVFCRPASTRSNRSKPMK